MSDTLLVSVIMPNYNKGQYVGAAIESILSQTYRNFELVVVDDGSTDESPSIIREFRARDSRIVYVERSHLEVSSARNIGIETAQGDLIAFMDSDDVCSKDKLTKQVNLFRNSDEIFLCHTNGLIVDQNGEATGKIFHRDLQPIPKGCQEGYLFSHLLRRNYLLGASMMIPKQCFKTEKFDTRLPLGQDTDLWVRLSRRYPFRYVSERLYGYRIYPGNRWSPENMDSILKSHVLRYEKWLQIFEDLDDSDRRVIVKHLWNCHAKLHNRAGMLKLVLRNRVALSLLVSSLKASNRVGMSKQPR